MAFGNKKRKILVLPSQKSVEQMAEKSKLSFKNAVDDVGIDGIDIVDEFLSREEEQMIMHELDQRKWVKLANRRV